MNINLPLYSQAACRPAFDPAILLRSFLLMERFHFSSVGNRAAEARLDPCIQYIIGSWYIPAAADHYVFIHRIMQVDPHPDEYYPAGKNSTEIKKQLRALKRTKREK